MLVTFHNVTVRVEAASPKEAYEILESAMASLPPREEADTWESDTFSTEDGPDAKWDTATLF